MPRTRGDARPTRGDRRLRQRNGGMSGKSVSVVRLHSGAHSRREKLLVKHRSSDQKRHATCAVRPLATSPVYTEPRTEKEGVKNFSARTLKRSSPLANPAPTLNVVSRK